MRKLLFAAVCICTCLISNAQESKNVQREFSEKAAFPFQQLERHRVPHGILENYALGLTEITLYDGVVRDTNLIDIQVFSNIFRELHSGRIHTSSEEDFVSMEDYAKRWVNYRTAYNSADNDEKTMVLGGLLYNYSMITSDALSEGRITFEGNQFRDVYTNGEWQNPYKEAVAVAVSTPVHTVTTDKFHVVLPRDMFLGNAADNIESMTIDFGNGENPKSIAFDEPVEMEYAAAGSYIWKVKIRMDNGWDFWTRIPIEVIERIRKQNVRIDNGNYGAVLRIDYLDDDDMRITRPLIVAEGFDPGSVINPEVTGGSTTLNNFTSSLRGLLQNRLDASQEYDIIYIDWDNGIGDIRQNAETLKKIIKYVNDQKAANGSTESNILLGQSMGGLIGKYALVKLEEENYDHDVALFATHDSPLRGSNTPVGVQFMGRHVLEMYVGNPFASTIGELVLPLVQDLFQLFGSEILQDFSTPADNLTLMDAPAAVQMNNYYVSPAYEVKADYHNIWQTEFDALGYPTQSRNIAISNGNMCGVNQGYDPGTHLLKFTKETDQNEFKSVLRDMGMTFWGATSHMPNLVIASLIPGSSRLRIDFQIKVLPETYASDREVYRGILKYDKFVEVPHPVFFWKKVRLGTITVNMYDKKGYAPNTCLPVENVAGGKESISGNIPDMIDDVTNVGQYVVNSDFSFVPVTSALDIRRNNANPNIQDYRRSYSSTNLNDVNLSSPFDNFLAESDVQNNNNELERNFRHIRFTVKSGNFLAREMTEATNNTVNFPNTACEAFCYLDEIFGVDTICVNQQESFSIPEIPNGTVTWTVGADLEIVPDNDNSDSTIKVKVRDSYHGGANTISVTVNSGDCGTKTLTKTVNVGMEGPTVIYGSNQIPVSSNPNLNFPPGERTYNVDPVPDADYYEWDVTGGFLDVASFSSQPAQWEILASTKNTNEITVKPSGPATLKVRACNDCGCSNYIYLYVKPFNVDDYIHYYPSNPSDDILTIFVNETYPPQLPNEETQVLIYDMSARLKKQFTISSSQGGSTNVSDLETGIYKGLIDLQNGTYQEINIMISR